MKYIPISGCWLCPFCDHCKFSNGTDKGIPIPKECLLPNLPEKRSLGWLDEALNEGDGVYRP